MTGWLLLRWLRRAPGRVLLGSLAVAFPVALLASTLLFLDTSVHAMTRTALRPTQVEQRALATSLDVDMNAVRARLATVPGVTAVDRFAAVDVLVAAPGRPERVPARLFAVDPSYVDRHPWVEVQQGVIGPAALLNPQLAVRAGIAGAQRLSLTLPGGDAELATVPVGGRVDLRRALSWFAVPTGEIQGDIAAVPQSLVLDYATFERTLRPALTQALGGSGPVLNPGLDRAPPVDVEAHVQVDHAAYPSDPAVAVQWSTTLRHQLERQAPGAVLVTDDAAEALTAAKDDATNAKALFLLLGLPGVLAALALGLAAESALLEAHRREEGLLRLRGATEQQLARLTAAQSAAAGLGGLLLGLGAAALAVEVLVGPPWRDAGAGRLLVSVGVAVALGVAVVVVRVRRVLRRGGGSAVVEQRRQLERGWAPSWLTRRLDLWALGVAAGVLLLNQATGGLRRGVVEGPPLALFLFVLVAPIALWLALSLLAVRLSLRLLAARSRPDAQRPARSWRGLTLRWLGRRPARAAVALALGTMAVAFGTDVLTFVGNYTAAQHQEVRAGVGADLRLTATTQGGPAPTLHDGVTSTSPVRFVPARVGSDRKSLLAVDVDSYLRTAAEPVSTTRGAGVTALRDPGGVLVAEELAFGFGLSLGEALPVTLLPDDPERSRTVTLLVLGMYRAAPPTQPYAELLVGVPAVPPALLPAPDFHLAQVAAGVPPGAAATAYAQRDPAFRASTVADAEAAAQRSLTALNLTGLSRLETAGAALVATVGLAVLGAFLVLERRRELAVLRACGADTAQLLTGPAQEGIGVILGSLVLGVPIGLALAALSSWVLALFFLQPPPLLAVPTGWLGALLLLVAGGAGAALAATLVVVARDRPARTLRG